MAEIILPGRDFARGVHQTSEETKGGIIVPRGFNAASVRVLRDSWTDRAGDGRAEQTGIIDPVTQREEKVVCNRDEAVRLWLFASGDNGQSWECAGMCGTRGGTVPDSIQPGSLVKPVLIPGLETTLITRGLAEGDLLRVVMECLTGVRAEVDIEFITSPLSVPIIRHNSVGFVAVNSASATSASSISSGNITPSGDDRLVIVNGALGHNGAMGNLTVTWDGGAVDNEIVDYEDEGFPSDARVAAGEVVAPDTSAAQGTITHGSSVAFLTCGSLAFDGVDQATPTGGVQTTTSVGTSASLGITDVNADDMVCDVIFGATSVTVDESDTSRWEETVAAAVEGGSSTTTGTGTVTAGWNSGAAGIVYSAWRINAADAGPSPISASLGIDFSGSANLKGTGALAADVPIAISQSSNLQGIGALAADIPIAFDQSAAIESFSAISASIPVTFSHLATLEGAGALATTIPVTFSQLAALNATGDLAASIPIAFDISAAMEAPGDMAATIPITFSQLAALEGAGALSAVLPIQFSQLATLAGTGNLSAGVSIAFDVSGNVENAIAGAISGAITITFTQSATLDGTGALEATIPITFDVFAALDQLDTAIETGGGSGGKQPHGSVVLPTRTIELPKDYGYTDEELAAIAIAVIQEFYEC